MIEKCIHQLFEAQVKQRPNEIAVTYQDRQITYLELNQKANQLAYYLKSLGVKPESLVGICLERSIEMLVGLLGILKAGGAYVPIDPNYPEERISFVLEDAQMSILITQSTHLDKLPEHNAQIICLDPWEEFTVNNTDYSDEIAFTQSEIQPSNLAYVIYTSGSTGKPKGVLVEHQNVTRLFTATQAWYHFNERDVWTMFHSFAFDFAVWEIWGALLYGGRLVVVPYQTSRTPEAFYQLLVTEKVTVLNQTPSAFYQLIRADKKLYTINKLNLRFVIFGGEALNLSNLQPWFDRHGDRSPQLVNMYGITETTVHVTYRPINTIDLNSPGSVIGFPIPDLQLYLLDSDLEQVAVGNEGEIYVGGAGVARGYYNRPELTAQRFIPNPFSDRPEAKLYKSGDLARYLDNGDLEYLGRIDNQVKIRGFRIELGEVEAKLTQHPQVEKCVVLAKEDFSGSQILVGYIRSQDNSIIETSNIREFLAQRLPEYMIPAAFISVDVFPLTDHGKLDRRALLKMNANRQQPSKAIAPNSELEITLVRIWSEVLNIKTIGIRDSFFDLGGHSLLAISLFNKIEQELGKNIPVSAIFQAPTIEELARYIEDESVYKQDKLGSLLVPLQPCGTKPPIFLVHGGAGEIYLYRELAKHLDPDQPVYGIEPIGTYDCQTPLFTIEAMATRYIAEIKTLQPTGPYLLGGYCLGGQVVYEMTQILQKQGEQVKMLALIDVYINYSESTTKKVISWVDKLLSFDVRQKAEHIQRISLKRWIALQLLNKLWQVYPQIWLAIPKKWQKEFKRDYFLEISRQAIAKYEIQPYRDRLKVIFFRGLLGRVNKTLANERELLLMPAIWQEIVANSVKFVDLKANHRQIVYEKDNMATIGRELKQFLSQLDQ